jgi:opacity protein-like surface antigen
MASPARLGLLFVLTAGAASHTQMALAQPAIVSDLWRVAAGTLVVPAALAADGSAALWTPATAIPLQGPAVRLGVEAVHAPSEVGINGGVATLAVRAAGLGTLNLVYGRLGVDGLVRTETSPEAIGGDIAAYAEVLSLGLARELSPGLVAGVAARALSGRLDVNSRSQLGVDVGVRYTSPSRLSVGFATRFFDPTLSASGSAASYNAAASYRTADGPVWGTTGALTLRYGVTFSRGEGLQHLISAGLDLAGVTELDVGAAREETADVPVWRSRFGLSLDVGRYRVYLGRDGGVNGFGATYRFGLAVKM